MNEKIFSADTPPMSLKELHAVAAPDGTMSFIVAIALEELIAMDFQELDSMAAEYLCGDWAASVDIVRYETVGAVREHNETLLRVFVDVSQILKVPLLTEPLTKSRLREIADSDGLIEVMVSIGLVRLACSSEDGTLDGLNNIVDEMICPDAVEGLAELEYTVAGVDLDCNEVLILVTADASDILAAL